MRAPRRLTDTAGLVLLVVTVVAPVVFSLGYAVLYSTGSIGLLSDGVTAEHWRSALGRREIWSSLGLSVYVATVTVALTTVLSLGLLRLVRPSRVQRGPLSWLIYLPLTLPGTVAAFLTFYLFSGGGLAGRVATAMGLLSTPAEVLPLVHDRWALGVIVTHVAIAVPFFTLLFAGLYESERLAELERLALALGAERWQRWRRVTVPVLLRGAATNLALFFIVVLGSFEIPFLLGRQAPQMVSVLTYQKFALFDLGQRPQAFVLSVLYSLVVFTLLGFLFARRSDG